MNPLALLGAMAALSSSETSALVTIQIGLYVTSPLKLADIDCRGSIDAIQVFEQEVTPGNHSPLNVLGARLYNIGVSNREAPLFRNFRILFEGDTSATIPNLRITPQNFGGSLVAPAQFPFQGPTTTGYQFELPNANLFNNWAVSSVRTCLLEIV